MKRIDIIINPISGTISKSKIPALSETLFPANEYNKFIHYTECSGHAVLLTKEALNQGSDYILAAGGDGTVNEIARTMVHSNTALGIIPCGSGNGLARDLGIPMDIKKAMQILSMQNVTTIDYCKANDYIFFCTCGFGFDALISERFSQEKQRGSLSYIKSVIKEYMRFNPEDYELIIDGVTIKKKAFLMTCANASQYGNSAFIAPKANIRDGKMDIVIVSPINPIQAAPLAVQLFTKQLHNNNKTHSYQAKNVSIIRQNKGVMHVDGDPITVGKKIDIKIFSAGLKVLVPTEDQKQTYFQVQVQDFRSLLREASLWISNLGN